MMSVASCLAQTNHPANSTPEWEHLTNHIHMLAYFSNEVFAPGSNIQVRVRIINTSANAVAVYRRDSGDVNLPRLRIELMGDSGQIYELATVEMTKAFGVMPIPVFAGATNEWKVPVEIKTNIASGNYKLRLTQLVYFMDGDYNQRFELSAIAQTNQPATSTPAWDHLTYWDDLTSQVHLSAFMSNNVVATGSNVEVLVRTSNASTNKLGVLSKDLGGVNHPDPMIDLISDAGQVYKLASTGPVKAALWVSGKTTNEWKVPVDITTNIGSGRYTLKVTESVFFMGLNEPGFELGADTKLVIK